MKAIVVKQTGGPEVLKLEQADDPKAAAGQAVVKLQAAGVNFIDTYHRRGLYPKEVPFVVGLEAAGVVESVGPGVSAVKPGDHVAYTGVPGAYAEKSVVPADKLIPVPEGMSFEQAAAMPLQGMTAHYLLHEYYKPKAGDTVMVHAAAGGMGLLLVQWAKHLGARVFGTVSSTEKAKLAKEAGADEVIIYTKEDWVAKAAELTGGKGLRLIIDGVGKTTFPGDLQAVSNRGNIVIFGSASGRAEPIHPNDLQTRSITVSGGSLFNYLNTREELMERANAVLRGIKEGWLKLHIGKVLPLEQAQEAHRLLENRETTGKIILKV
jgi:NADPH2:quinone reductase